MIFGPDVTMNLLFAYIIDVKSWTPVQFSIDNIIPQYVAFSKKKVSVTFLAVFLLPPIIDK